MQLGETTPQAPRLLLVGGGHANIALLKAARRWTGAGVYRPEDMRIDLLRWCLTGHVRFVQSRAVSINTGARTVITGRGEQLPCDLAVVDLRLGTKVEQVEHGVVILEGGERLAQDEVLWATGTQGQSLFQDSGLPVDDRGYVRVDRCLRALGYSWLFAAGDCASLEGHKLDRSGVNAVKQGLSLRGNVDRLLRGLQRGRAFTEVPLAPFRSYPVAPYLVSTGQSEGLLALGPNIGLRGPPLLWLKHLADRTWIRRYHFPE